MTKSITRYNGRAFDQVRPISITYNAFGYADASVLMEIGNTKVLCTVTLTPGVPPFLKGTKTGWLTAEYALLPTSTVNRTQREGASQKYNGRSVEIARFIGRSLRTMVDLSRLGERTITVDCDVLQADGGTRTACITASALALKTAVQKWNHNGLIAQSIIIDDIAALSVGLADAQPLLDIDYQEDIAINADYNFVLSRSGSIIEIQGTAEKGQVSWQAFEKMCRMAQEGIKKLFVHLDTLHTQSPGLQRVPFFSLKNRLHNSL